MNIVNDHWNKKLIETDSLFYDLIKNMINPNPIRRPEIQKVFIF